MRAPTGAAGGDALATALAEGALAEGALATVLAEGDDDALDTATIGPGSAAEGLNAAIGGESARSLAPGSEHPFTDAMTHDVRAIRLPRDRHPVADLQNAGRRSTIEVGLRV